MIKYRANDLTETSLMRKYNVSARKNLKICEGPTFKLELHFKFGLKL
jgi:hypothetical protein